MQGKQMAQVKRWADFQHYKNRCPPWIKLQKSILDDFDFSCLPIASKALAPLIWLLASESLDGKVCIDHEFLAFRLRFTVKDIKDGLTPLIEKGFLIVDSSVLAKSLQDACLEGEGEGEKRSLEQQAARKTANRFDEFWKSYPVKKGRAKAEAQWKAKGYDAIADTIIEDVKKRCREDRQWLDGYAPHGSTYINSRGWEDDIERRRETIQQVPDHMVGAL